jgi:hypothetical protein
MALPNAFVKVSGLLLHKKYVIRWIKTKLQKKYHIVIGQGAGPQISEKLHERGIEYKFWKLIGREIYGAEGRKIALDATNENCTITEDLLQKAGVIADVEIPFLKMGSVDVPINGDLMAINALLGFDKIFILSEGGKMADKGVLLEEFSMNYGLHDLFKKKVQVVGFDKKGRAHYL